MRIRTKNGEVCFLQSSGERVFSKDSVSTCSASWFVYPYESGLSHTPVVNKSSHPIWNGLYCKSVSIKKYGDGALITAQYEGAESWSSTNDQHENTVEVSCTMREEPIESHPDFERWGGKPRQAQLRNIRRRRQIRRLEFQSSGRQNNGGDKKLPCAVVFGGGRLHFKGNAEPRRNRLNWRRQRTARSRRKPPVDVHGNFL